MDRKIYLGLLNKHKDDDLLDVKVAKELVNSIFESFESRTCENCKYFKKENGLQPDNMTWTTIECENGIWIEADIEYEKLSCVEWESKND